VPVSQSINQLINQSIKTHFKAPRRKRVDCTLLLLVFCSNSTDEMSFLPLDENVIALEEKSQLWSHASFILSIVRPFVETDIV